MEHPLNDHKDHPNQDQNNKNITVQWKGACPFEFGGKFSRT